MHQCDILNNSMFTGGLSMVSSEVGLNKMMKELQAAMQATNNEKVMLEHIANIRLLTDLFIEENQTKEPVMKENVITKQEEIDNNQSNLSVTNKIARLTDDDGTSIFDF